MISITEIQQRHGAEMALAVLTGRVYFNTAGIVELADYISLHNIDWRVFEKIISVHHFRPLAYKTLTTQGLNIDSTFFSKLKAKCLKLAAVNLQQLDELKAIDSAFKTANIGYVPYKGIVLSHILFDDITGRETVDIDLLLKDSASFSSVRAILQKMGYTSDYYHSKFERQFLRTSHELQFTRDTALGQLKVEVHWDVTSRMMSVRTGGKNLLQQTQRASVAGLTMDVFDPAATLFTMLIHHGVNDVWRSQKHTIDIAAFLFRYSSGIDWQTFEKLTVQSRIRHTAEVGFMLAEQLYGAEVPRPFRNGRGLPATKVISDLLRFPVLDKGKLRRENLSRQLFLRDSFLDKVGLVASYLKMAITPNIRDVQAMPLPKGLYWLYYVIKPFRMFLRRGKKTNEKK